MERFFFERPSIDRKEDIIDYLNEFVEYDSDINGIGELDKVLYGYSFEEALERCLNVENKEYAESIGRCQEKTFLLIRESDNKLIGTLNLRWNLTEKLLNFGGHIGYGIRPTERKHGYNKINLYQGMLEAKKVGLDKVMLNCDVNNIASDKTLKSLGGELVRSEIDPSDGVLTNVYWFDVDKTIDRYKNIYGACIKRNNTKIKRLKNDKSL